MTEILTYEDYNKNSFAVRGEREKYSSLLKVVGARWNSRMKKGPGWLVKKEYEEQLKNIISTINKDNTLFNIKQQAKPRKKQHRYHREESNSEEDEDTEDEDTEEEEENEEDENEEDEDEEDVNEEDEDEEDELFVEVLEDPSTETEEETSDDDEDDDDETEDDDVWDDEQDDYTEAGCVTPPPTIVQTMWYNFDL